MGRYLYCIVPCSEERTFEGAVPVGNLSGRVHTIPHDGLSLVVSDSLVNEFDTTRTNMVAHERVLEKVLADYPVLPVRFGTVADATFSLDDMRKLLHRRSREFVGLLEEVRGRVELGLKALWKDEKAIFQEVVAENPDIRHLRDALANRPRHASRYQAMTLGEMVKAALEAKRTKEGVELMGRFRPLAHSTRQNALVADRMVLNAAFLVDTAREAEFDRAVEQCSGEMDQRLALKYVGPVPPYNFVNIVVNWREL